MARMHARRKGISRSVRPYRKEAPSWSTTDAKEIEKIVLDLKKQGKAMSEIGLILRDKHGVPDVKLATGKRIGRILAAAGVESRIPEDLQNLIVKALGMRKHMADNKNDLHNKRQLQLTESKVRRLVKYYISSGKLPQDWEYKPETAEMMLSR
jgi:small subunit ribosomal protein S15